MSRKHGAHPLADAHVLAAEDTGKDVADVLAPQAVPALRPRLQALACVSAVVVREVVRVTCKQGIIACGEESGHRLSACTATRWHQAPVIRHELTGRNARVGEFFVVILGREMPVPDLQGAIAHVNIKKTPSANAATCTTGRCSMMLTWVGALLEHDHHSPRLRTPYKSPAWGPASSSPTAPAA